MGKSKEQYKNDVLMDLFFLSEKEGNPINIKKYDLIHKFYNTSEKKALKNYEEKNLYLIKKDKKNELKKEIESIRKCYCDVFYKLCDMQKDIDKQLKPIKNARKVIENHTLRCILETASYYYGMPRFEGRETQYRYVSKNVYDEIISKGKMISEFDGSIHYEHVIPMNELIKLLKNKDQNFDTFDEIMKTKMIVCCVSDKENKKLKKNSMPKENKGEWKQPAANEKYIWDRYITAGIQVYDLYKDKPILPIKENSTQE